jgi:LemA protein
MIFLIIPIIIFVLLAIYFIAAYNRLVRLKNSAAAAWHQIDVHLTRRADLVGNLVETVKGYAAHEKTVLEDVTNARSSVMQSKSAKEAGPASGALDSALSRLFAVAENYPNLKANENFLSLQAQLTEIENRIASAREYYNETVRSFNISCQSFPANIFAQAYGFTPKDYFEVAQAKIEPPKVSFS